MAEVDVVARVGDTIQLTDPDTGKIYHFDATVLMQELNNPENDQFDKRRLWQQMLVDLKDVPQPQFTDRGKTLIYRPDANGRWNFIWSAIASQGTIDIFEERLDELGDQLDGFIESLSNKTNPALGANLVGFQSSVGGSIGRTVAQELDDFLNVRRFITTPVDGTTSNQDGITTAVAIAKLLETDLYWPRGTYVSTANIPDFWEVNHVGSGVIRRNSNLYYITPKKAMENIIEVASGGLTLSDGLSVSEPTTMAGAVSHIRTIGEKAQNGMWAIHINGTIPHNGISFRDMPAFKNRLRIFGDAPNNKTEPTSVWDGTTATEAYAFRGDWSRNTSNVYLRFENIKFTNWNKSSNAGGIVIWSAGDVSSDNLWFDNCSIGAWYRQCYVKHYNGRISNAQTFGIGVQYAASGNIGNLLGDGVQFVNCNEGISVGRQTTCYIQGCSFDGCGSDITATRNSRIRPQANTHANWTYCCYLLQANGVLTPDNNSGSPDIFLTTPTDTTPVLRCDSGSVHTAIHRTDTDINAFNFNGSLASVSGAVGTPILLSQAPGVTGGDFTPARVPAYWGYSVTASLDIDLFISMPANAGGTLELRAGPSLVLASLVFPTAATGRSGMVNIKFFRRAGVAVGRYSCTFNHQTLGLAVNGTTASLNNAVFRAPNEDTLLYRLYWTPADGTTTTLADMKTRITA